MSLSKRLNNVLSAEPPTRPASIEEATLEVLAQTKVTWRKSHLGETFQEAWSDADWTKFMVSRFSKSPKEDHQKYIKFVELKVAEMEEHQEPVPPSRGPMLPSSKAASKPKSKPASKPPSSPSIESQWLQEDFEVDDSELEMYIHPTMNSQMEQQAEMMTALQQRMLHMESALTRVINHLEDQNRVQEQ